MSKNKGKNKKIKKPIKPERKLAAKSAGGKAKKGKVVMKTPIKKTAKPVKKAAIKKQVVKKNSKPVKKISEPVKKAVKHVKPANKKVDVESIKKAVPKTVATKDKKVIVALKVAKPVKKEEKVLKVEPKKGEKIEKIKAIKEKPLKPKGKGGRKPKSKGDDDEPEIVHDELIEQIIQSTRKQAKQPKQPKIIKTFVNPMISLAGALPIKKVAIPKKEPKGKFELEYVVRTSTGILYELLTTPSGLSEWFADDVNIRDGIFTFFWDGSEQKARLLAFKEDKYVRFQWLDKPEGSYFEFRIEKDDLTGDISLMIVDFADEASDMETSKLLWDSQVNKLLYVLGSN